MFESGYFRATKIVLSVIYNSDYIVFGVCITHHKMKILVKKGGVRLLEHVRLLDGIRYFDNIGIW